MFDDYKKICADSFNALIESHHNVQLDIDKDNEEIFTKSRLFFVYENELFTYFEQKNHKNAYLMLRTLKNHIAHIEPQYISELCLNHIPYLIHAILSTFESEGVGLYVYEEVLMLTKALIQVPGLVLTNEFFMESKFFDYLKIAVEKKIVKIQLPVMEILSILLKFPNEFVLQNVLQIINIDIIEELIQDDENATIFSYGIILCIYSLVYFGIYIENVYELFPIISRIMEKGSDIVLEKCLETIIIIMKNYISPEETFEEICNYPSIFDSIINYIKNNGSMKPNTQENSSKVLQYIITLYGMFAMYRITECDYPLKCFLLMIKNSEKINDPDIIKLLVFSITNIFMTNPNLFTEENINDYIDSFESLLFDFCFDVFEYAIRSYLDFLQVLGSSYYPKLVSCVNFFKIIPHMLESIDGETNSKIKPIMKLMEDIFSHAQQENWLEECKQKFIDNGGEKLFDVKFSAHIENRIEIFKKTYEFVDDVNTN